MDPFKFLERDGYFYGRGTTDIKCEDADLVANFIRLKQEGYVPDRDLIVALTEDEENGTANGVQWLIANRRDLIDADYCINPDGGNGELKNGRPVVMEVQTSEKIYCDFSLEATNKGGHSSLPVRDNAIYHLAGALTRIAAFEFPIKLNETTRMFFERSARHETGQAQSDMLAMAGAPLDTAAANRARPVVRVLQRTHAHNLRGDNDKRRARGECSSPIRPRQRQLQDAPRRTHGGRAGNAPVRRRGLAGRCYTDKRNHRRGPFPLSGPT